MRRGKLSFTFVVVGMVLAIMLSASPMIVGEPDPQEKSFTDWMRSLPEKTRVRVETIFEQNLECLVDAEERGITDFSGCIEKIYCDLESVLTPGQYKAFTESNGSSSPGSQLSATLATCASCYSAVTKLNQALSNIGSAIGRYSTNRNLCAYHHGDIPVSVFMNVAKYYINLASQNAYNACNTCDCTSAQNALNYANTAKGYLNSAISVTYSNCDPNAPWLYYLYPARNWLNLAIPYLNNCKAEACN